MDVEQSINYCGYKWDNHNQNGDFMTSMVIEWDTNGD